MKVADLSHVLIKEVRAYVTKKIETTTAEYDELMKKDVLL